MEKFKKYYKKILLIIAIICITSTCIIGSYFVNFALVAKSGGENRPKIALNIEEDKIISKNKKALETQRDKWLAEVKDYTKKISVSTLDGLRLIGHTYEQNSPTDKWVIIVHGYQSSENRSKIYGAGFYKLGYNVLTYSLRGHKPSEGKYITMGDKDSEDLMSFINLIIKENPKAQIALHGTSMGGATVLNASGKILSENVKAIIDDCGYADLWKIFKKELRLRFNLPSFPVLYMANIMGNIKSNITISSIKPIEEVKKSAIPIMFIHTTGDDFVPVSDTYLMYDAKEQGYKEKYIINGFGHADAVFADSDYFKKIDAFIKKSSD